MNIKIRISALALAAFGLGAAPAHAHRETSLAGVAAAQKMAKKFSPMVGDALDKTVKLGGWVRSGKRLWVEGEHRATVEGDAVRNPTGQSVNTMERGVEFNKRGTMVKVKTSYSVFTTSSPDNKHYIGKHSSYVSKEHTERRLPLGMKLTKDRTFRIANGTPNSDGKITDVIKRTLSIGSLEIPLPGRNRTR